MHVKHLYGINIGFEFDNFPRFFENIVHAHNKIIYDFKNHQCSSTILCYSTFLQQIFTMIQFVHYEHNKFIQNEK